MDPLTELRSDLSKMRYLLESQLFVICRKLIWQSLPTPEWCTYFIVISIPGSGTSRVGIGRLAPSCLLHRHSWRYSISSRGPGRSCRRDDRTSMFQP
jgi:hypothetical protein